MTRLVVSTELETGLRTFAAEANFQISANIVTAAVFFRAFVLAALLSLVLIIAAIVFVVADRTQWNAMIRAAVEFERGVARCLFGDDLWK